MHALGDLIPFAVLGLLGAAHCAGMCGGFSIAVATSAQGGRRRALLRQATYLVGKAVTYSLLGVLAATAAHLLAHGGSSLVADEPGNAALVLGRIRAAMAGFAAVLLVAFGLAALGVRLPAPSLTSPRWTGFVNGLRGAFARVTGLEGYAGALGTGLFTGLLPCGLSWSALALAAAYDPATAAVGLFLFGLATGPALVVVGLVGHSLTARRRTLALRFVGPALIVFGILTALRAGAEVGEASAVLPACCAGAAATR